MASPELASVKGELWEKAEADDVQAALDSGEVGPSLKALGEAEDFILYEIKPNSAFPLSFAFKTRAGGKGLLQIIGFTEGGAGVKIRYKLLRGTANNTKKSQTAESAASESVREPIVDHVVIGQSGGPWIGRMPKSGITVELLGVSENPSKDKPWWKPDGSPLAERPYEDLGGGWSSPENNSYYREFAVRLGNLPSAPVVTRWSFIPACNHLIGGPLHSAGRGNAAFEIHAVGTKLPPSAGSPLNPGHPITIHVGVAAGPWVNAGEIRPKDAKEHLSFDKIYVRRNASGMVPGPLRNVYVDVTKSAEDGSTRVEFQYDLIGEAVRIVAVARNGREHFGVNNSSEIDDVLKKFVDKFYVAFPDLPFDDLASLRLQTSPFQWAEFRNVALEANSSGAALVKPRLPNCRSSREA